MSTLQVANLHFESTGNNRLQYTGSNGYNLVAGGTTVATVNTTAVNFPLNLSINTIAVGKLTANNSNGVSGQALISGGTGNVYWGFASQAANVQTFNSSGTWNNPGTAYNFYRVQVWGAGGSGGRPSGGGGCGGGGGGYWEWLGPLSDLGNTETVTVGLGGSIPGIAGSDGIAGGSSSFTRTNSTTVTVYGGGGGGENGGNGGGGDCGGNGGSVLAQGTNAPSAPNSGNARYPGMQSPDAGIGGYFYAAYTSSANTSAETLLILDGQPGTTGGGGGGCFSGSATSTNGLGGNSIWGGGGGGSGAPDNSPGPRAGGTSIYGGNGGAGAFDGNNATAGQQPGGGGGGSDTGLPGAGGDGRVIVTVW